MGKEIGKEEIKSPLFSEDIILNVETPKEPTKKILKLISELGQLI